MRMHIKILSRYVEAFGGLTVLNTASKKYLLLYFETCEVQV